MLAWPAQWPTRSQVYKTYFPRGICRAAGLQGHVTVQTHPDMCNYDQSTSKAGAQELQPHVIREQ